VGVGSGSNVVIDLGIHAVRQASVIGCVVELTRHSNLEVEVNQLYPFSVCVTTRKSIPSTPRFGHDYDLIVYHLDQSVIQMSNFYSHPSPSKATTSTKRPYESTTPSNLGTPRDSTNGGRSPGPNKKPRSNEEGKDIGKGGQWMIGKLEELQRMYKEVLLAATAVIQYQTYALRLWVPLSIHLEGD